MRPRSRRSGRRTPIEGSSGPAGGLSGSAGRALLTLILLATPVAMARARPAPSAPVGKPDWVWWEAETPKATNFPAANPFGPRDARGARALSGGEWIGASAPDQTLFLEYQVTVPASGSYTFHARKFWQHGPFRWRIDDQPWRTCGRDVVLLDAVEVAPLVSANWVSLGSVSLKSGPHLVRIELLESHGPAAFDCFLLTREPFVARGPLKPGAKYNEAPEGWFPFEPDADPFAKAALDLRAMNEPRAGDGGFIQVKGDTFVHSVTGEPVRFWAVNVGHDLLALDRTQLRRYARQLAKLGVNMVRLHGPLWSEQTFAEIDRAKLDHIHLFLAALKREGIYLELSSYFPLWLKPKGHDPCFEGFDGDKPPFALAFFSKCFQDVQRGWWRRTLTAPNPYTGLSLAEDPALAFLEIVNEDSIFFWTFTPYQGVPAAQMEFLERRFGAWLVERTHRSLAQTLSRWGGAKIRGDDDGRGRAGILPLADLLRRRDARARDTAEFLADLQRTYYDGTSRYLKEELGFKGSVTGSNWLTADASILGPLDKWSNAGCDFMDRHGYFGGPHQGDRAAYLISPGDQYDDALAVRFDSDKPGEPSFNLPTMDLAYNGKPSTISEINWPPPNRFRTDMPVISAAYGALQGTDAFFFFATTNSGWSQRLEKFTIANPVAMGQFPAAALLYRRGLVRTADAVVHLEVGLSSLRALEGIAIAAPRNLDQLRMPDALNRWLSSPPRTSSVDPLAFLVGRVEVNVTDQGGVSRMADLSKLIDRQRKTVRSSTGELLWDWGRGLMTIDAPEAAGATGLLAQAGPIAFRDFTLSSRNEYGALLLVAMDGKPLGASAKMLLQVMTEDNNSGWSAPGHGLRRIVDIGGPPLVVRNIAGRVTFHRTDAASLKVTALDFNGYPVGVVRLDATHSLELQPKTFYYLLEK